MKTYEIALYPGDGIGPEVIEQTVRILAKLEAIELRKGDFRLRLTSLPWGSNYWSETGTVVPENFLERLRSFDAILLGAVGDPARIPDHITLDPLKRIRQTFDQYACVRPARLLQGVTCPLVGKNPSHIDLVVIRENSEGEYVDSGGRFKVGKAEEFALQSAIHTRRGVERILRFGFKLALTRRRRLTMVTKSNAQRYGYVLWDEILDELRSEFPSVAAEKQHADAAVMNLVRRPEEFDVVVASNLFGDILTDLGGLIAGGLGLAPSANLNPEREYPSMFEPVHGSAPDIAGEGIANPIAAILSAAMMLEWLGSIEAADCIRQAVASTLLQGAGTPDLGGHLNTRQMTDHILQSMGTLND